MKDMNSIYLNKQKALQLKCFLFILKIYSFLSVDFCQIFAVAGTAPKLVISSLSTTIRLEGPEASLLKLSRLWFLK